MSGPVRVVSRILNLKEHEGLTALQMFAYSFLAMTAYNIVRPATRSQVITSLGADNLPYVQLAAGVLIGVLMHGYTRLIARMHSGRVSGTQLGEVGLLLLFWVLFQTGAAWVSVAFYMLGLVLGVLLISQFWTLANELYDARQAKRVFGFIGGGAVLGGATGAGIAAVAARAVGTTNLLLLSAGILIVCVGLVASIVRHHDLKGHDVVLDEVVGSSEAIRWLRSSKHLQIIAMVIGLAAMGSTIIDQQLNMAAAAIKGSTDELTAFLGQVTFYLSMAGFFIQVALTSRIQAIGLGFALLILPVGLGATATVMLFTSAIWAPAMARGLDSALRYTVDKTTREILFMPLPTDLKYRAKPFVDVTVDRFARSLAALILLVLIKPWGLNFSWQQLSYASLSITGLWIIVAMRARYEYLATFRRGLETKSMGASTVGLGLEDAATLETLVEELSEHDEARVLHAIDMLETLDKRNLITPLLLHHDSPAVRARALRVLESARAVVAARWIPAIERLLKDDTSVVRAAAVRALASVRREDASFVMRRYLADPEPRVAAMAAAVLADSGNADDERVAEATLKRLSDDVRAVATPARLEAAAALGHIKNPAFRGLLLPLVSDHDLGVARTALLSARPLGPNDAIFLPKLIALLGHRELKPVARDVLASYGHYFLDALEFFLKDPDEDLWVRRHIPGTLGSIPTQRSVDILYGALGESDGFLRFKIITAIERLRREHPDLVFALPPLEQMLLKDTSRFYTYLTLRYNLEQHDPQASGSLLVRALGDKLERTLDRIYRLLGLIYPWKDISAARQLIALGDRRARAGALEYLDNLLTGVMRKRVMPILENTSLEELVRHANAVLKTRPRDLDDTLAQLIHDDDSVTAAAAIHFVERRALWGLIDDLDYVLVHASNKSYVAEAASWAVTAHRRTATSSGSRQPLPVVELVDRLRQVLLFDGISVDELFRIASTGRQVWHDANRELGRYGDRLDEVQFLLDGRVRLSLDDGTSKDVCAPAALAFEELLEGSPLRQTIRTVDPAVCLVLSGEQFRTMLSDNSLLVQGLVRMLLSAPAAERWRMVHFPTTQTDAWKPNIGSAMPALDKAIRLRQNPLLGQATVNQLLGLAAVAREIPLQQDMVLFAEGDGPAVYHLLAGNIRLEANGANPIEAGPGATIGIAETLAGVSIGRRAIVSEAGHALRIDRGELLDVIEDHVDLLQGIFGGLLRSRRF
ncbi:MAG TPA: HEAT repeat domain-containing protein [Vicinamibacterales bacterium]|jgi:ATP/ADP translocase/CRP-like cAMP-binding protein